MTHLKATCESHLCINFHERTCVRDSCKSHVYDTRDTSKSKHESFGLKVA